MTDTQNEDISKEELAARLDADFSLMTGEIDAFAKDLEEMFALND